MALTLPGLQPLLDQFKGDGPVVSCYADLSAAPGFPVRWPGPFKAKAAAIHEMLADDPRAGRQFERNFQAIGRALEAPEARHARGMAVFAALQRGFFQPYPLDVPVEDELVVHEAPYLVPLLQTLYRQREYLVVHSDTHRGRLYAATPGGLRLLQEVEATVPSRQHSAGERWGQQQATIARHREDRILHFQKELAERVEKAWAEHSFQGLVLLGEHEVLEHFRKRLPARLAAQVVHEGPQAWTDKPLAIEADIQAILTNARQAQEEHLREEFERRLREGYAVASGAGEVIEAVEKGRIGPRGHGYLVFGPDPREVVARCTACRSLWVEVPAACPRCQAPCVEASLWEELLLLALRHDFAAHFVRGDAELACRGGVAAMLPRQEPTLRTPVTPPGQGGPG
ncbi:MAG TPA: hypothetical protein VKA46_28980 [Gemmataceae bacterium]|nr:hypothetical protein [Gemmataceae bacterium]